MIFIASVAVTLLQIYKKKYPEIIKYVECHIAV